MTEATRIKVHWRDLRTDAETDEYLESRCDHLMEEFQEADSFEISFQREGQDIECHAHVDGKRTRLAAHSTGAHTSKQAAENALDKLEREMRKDHDKRIFGNRRKAQKAQPKRMEDPDPNS